MNTLYVCSKCGAVSDEVSGWLIGPRRKGEALVIRCPECITDYALRQVTLETRNKRAIPRLLWMAQKTNDLLSEIERR